MMPGGGCRSATRPQDGSGAGNLDVSQAGNYLAILPVDEAAPGRSGTCWAALTNALTVAQAHTVEPQAQAEKAAALAIGPASCQSAYSGWAACGS